MIFKDEEEDIRSRVASMFQNDEESDDEEEDMETNSPRSARKRKQLKHGKNVTSPTSSPSKRPRKLNKMTAASVSTSVFATPPNGQGSGAAAAGSMIMSAPAKMCQSSPALDLLESKKKVQRNSLYHWVLWREALRGEKDRATSSPTSAGSSINRSRLAFN